MLIDDLHISDIPYMDGWEEQLIYCMENLDSVPKFFLTEAFVQFGPVNDIVKNLSYLEKAKSLIRMPYPIIWAEERNGDKRTGAFILESEPDILGGSGRQILVYHFYSDGAKINFSHYSFLPDSYECRNGMVNLESCLHFPNNPKLEANIIALAVSIMDFAIRLNSPKVTDIKPCNDITKLNRKRVKSGKAALYEYKILDLSSAIKRNITQSGESGDKRFHWRRGHFKARKTGLYWWNPHTAGYKELGEIKKDYSV